MRAALIVLALAFPATAHGQTCQSYIGQTIKAQTFDAATASLSKLPSKKGEFETTADFDARVAAASQSLGSELVIAHTLDRKYIKYDADAGQFSVESYAYDNENADIWSFFYYQDMQDTASTMDNLDVVMNVSEKPNGSYEGNNAYGAKAKIAKINRTYKMLFESKAPFDKALFKKGDGAVLFTVTADIKTAPTLKQAFKGAFVVAPKAPFFLKGKGDGGNPTISNPVDIQDHFQVLIGDIRCALLMDSANNVVAAVETN